MSHCGCEGQCNCILEAGPGIGIAGTGTPIDPYVVRALNDDPANVEYADTGTVDMHFAGSGTMADPYEVSADVKIDPDGGLEETPQGLAVQIDPTPGNTLMATAEGLRTAGAAALDLDPAGGLEVTEAGELRIKRNPTSTAPINLGAAGLSVGTDAALEARMERITHLQRGQRMLLGGHDRTANSTHLFWTGKMFFIPPRGTADQKASFYEIEVPASGAVITGVGGAANVTIPTSGNYQFMIPLGDWQALWYLLPLESTSGASVPGNFRISSYTAAWDVPDNAVLVAYRDGSTGKIVTWGDGHRTVPWIPSNAVLRSEQNGGVVGIGSAGVQAHWYRQLDQQIEFMGWVQWAGSGIMGPLGSLYVDWPISLPGYVVPRGNWNATGVGKFYSAPGTGAGGMDWPVQPWIAAGSNRMYFLVPAAGNDCRLQRMRLGDPANPGPGRSYPLITERYIDTAGSELHYQMTAPIRNPNQ